MNYQDIFAQMGMKPKESTLYVELLTSGPSTVSSLSKKTGLNRPMIYKLIPLLQKQGLVSASPKGKQMQYIAESPDKLTRLLENTQDNLKNNLIPELNGLFQLATKQPIVKVLYGAEGITFVFDDLLHSLKNGESYYRYSSINNKTYQANKYLPKDFAKRRDQKQIGRFVITSENIHENMKPNLDREEKIIPAKYDTFDDNIAQYIYANKVAFVDYTNEMSFIIENPVMAQFQKKIFKLLYAKL